jgi:protein-S-isoprenylcysteine O-methyltransferase Ste14
MAEERLHGLLIWVVLAMAPVTFLYLLRRAAPYGRHYADAGWGPHISARLAWIIMELPAPAVFLVVHLNGGSAFRIAPLLFLVMWQGHYLNRTFVYPFRVRSSGRKTPLVLVGSGFFFNAINAYINARFISEFGDYATEWLADPRFLIGVGIFLAGLALNLHSDNVLMRLRRPGETGYAIPRGGGFRFVSCPNYLGEILEWTGWAVATWSSGGLAFMLFTVANLAPRARSNHRWYRETFSDYPANRRALIPGIY